MKLYGYFTITLLLLFYPCHNLGATGVFTIQGVMQGADKQWAYLDYRDENNTHFTDSAYVTNGQFKFEGKVETPTFGILYFPVARIQQNFFFEPGLTVIKGDTSKDSHLLIEGGKSIALFVQYRHVADSFAASRDALVPFITGPDAIKDSARHARYMDNYYLSLSEEENFTEQFVRRHADSYVSAYLLYYKFSGEGNINKGIALLHVLSKQVQQSKYIQLLLQRQAALMAVLTGKTAPAFSEPDSSGKMVHLSDIKAPYILVDFWASWCGPCRRENPGLVSAYRKYHTRGLEIVSISFDQRKQAWLNAVSKDGLTWINLCSFTGMDDDEVALQYGVTAIPSNFLIDKTGKIIAKNLMGSGLDYQLGKLLGK